MTQEASPPPRVAAIWCSAPTTPFSHEHQIAPGRVVAAKGVVRAGRGERHRIRRVPYIGVPRAVVERRMQRGQLVGGPQARVPLYVPYADFFQYQAGPGRLADRA